MVDMAGGGEGVERRSEARSSAAVVCQAGSARGTQRGRHAASVRTAPPLAGARQRRPPARTVQFSFALRTPPLLLILSPSQPLINFGPSSATEALAHDDHHPHRLLPLCRLRGASRRGFLHLLHPPAHTPSPQSEVERKKYFDELLTLKHTCLRDGKPYIRALVGGSANTSREGAGKGFDVSGAALALRCI